MPSSIKEKLFAAASVDTGLKALLQAGTMAPFRWWDQQVQQKYGFPAVSVMIVSNPRTYAVTGQLPTSFARVQFTIYGTGNDSSNANAVANALSNFLASFCAYGFGASVPAHANNIVSDRDFGIAETQPQTYMRIIDASIFDNSDV